MTGLHVELRHRFPTGFSMDVAFDVPPGVTVLFGPSGSGKTTVLEAIAGLLDPHAGRMVLNGKEIIYSPPRQRKVGYVFQNLSLFHHLTVAENIGYWLSSLSSQERERRAREIMERFRIAHVADQPPRTVSGGERQRTALARTLVTNPEALLLDEPMSALDIGIKREIIADLRAWLAARRIPVLYVTHILHEAFSLGENVIVLREGRILRQGTPQEALATEREYLLSTLAR
jgi:molybdate transport system ATP-binding protein